MTCVDVMYQPTYAPYFAYQRPSPATESLKKFGGVPKMHHEPLDTGTYSSPTHTSSPPSVSITKHDPHEDITDKGDLPSNTQYLSSNCLLLTYFNGDIAANVDEHFTRALSQPSSFNAENQGSKPGASYRDPTLMSQRNFPASFWNSNYQPAHGSLSASHHDPLSLGHSSTDPYVASSFTLHHQDPWRYLPSSQAHSAYSHHSMHDFAYSSMAASSSRFNPHYSSLLPGAASRLGAMPGQCDTLSKHVAPDTWSSRYHSEPLGGQLTSHHDTHHSLHTAAAISGGTVSLFYDGGEKMSKDCQRWY